MRNCQFHQLLEQLFARWVSPNLSFDGAGQQNVVALAHRLSVHSLNNFLAHRLCRHLALALLALLVDLELLEVSVRSERTKILPWLVVEKAVYLTVERRLESVFYNGVHVLNQKLAPRQAQAKIPLIRKLRSLRICGVFIYLVLLHEK